MENQTYELLTNSDCQLIINGKKPEKGLEVIVYGDEYATIERNADSKEYYFNMPKDGRFQYFILDITGKPEDLLEYIQDNRITPIAETFSICRLRNCLLEMEKDHISNFLKGCKTDNHCANDTKNVTRDFLLSTIFVLEHLICSGFPEKASIILRNLESCQICPNGVTNDCGCNGKNK